MAKYDELPVYKASYDLLIEIFRFTKDFALAKKIDTIYIKFMPENVILL